MAIKYSKKSSRKTIEKNVVAWSTLILFLAHPIAGATGVTPDANAPLPNRPVVETNVNGVTIVQISNPSAAGVSRNLYQQFNVDPRGLILNNSQIMSSTQLAGLINGNIHLNDGSARIILNEVTSNNPSFLRGYMEVAGQKADVIIANPNGITGDGFGFINTNRGVLTTGSPVFGGNGSLEAFRVAGGKIAIQGAGMDARNVDQVDLISRTMELNGKVAGNRINGIAGLNTVDYQNLNITQSGDDSNKPEVAIDVGLLGGVYAQKIYLVGTEQGVGVNSNGALVAINEVKITSDGKVVLANNQTRAGTDIYVEGKEGVTLQGAQVTAGNDVQLVGNNITLTGTKKQTTSNKVDTTGGKEQHKQIIDESIAFSNLTAQGQITLQSTGNIVVEASDMNSKQGSVNITASKDIILKEMTEHHEKLEEASSTTGNVFAKTTTKSSTHTLVDTVKGSSVVGENVSMYAGNNLTVKNSKVVSGQDVALRANHDVDITTAQETREYEEKFDQRAGFAHNKGQHDHVLAQKVEAMGSVIAANQGAVTIVAGNQNGITGANVTGATDVTLQGQDIVVAGSNLSSKDANVHVAATNHIKVQGFQGSREVVEESHSSSEGIFSHKVTEKQDKLGKNGLTSSNIAGTEVVMTAGQDMSIAGSNIVANKDVSLFAKGDLTITTAQKLTETEKNTSELHAGIALSLGKGGIDLFAGVDKAKNQNKQQQLEAISSTIVGKDGKVTVAAGTDVTVSGSTIMSATGTKITGENISIEAAEGRLQSQQVEDTKKLGLHITAGNTAINSASDSVNTAIDYFKKGQEASDLQTKAIYDTRVGSAVLDAVQAVKKVDDLVKDLNVGIGISGSIQNVKNTSDVKTAQGSQLVSAGDIELAATNRSVKYDNNTMMAGNIQISGSTLTGQNVILTADNDVKLQAGSNQSHKDSRTIGGSGEASVKLGFTKEGTGVNVGVGATLNGGKSVDTSVSYSQTTVVAKDNLQITAGRDMAIIGAQARGEKVTATVGRNLTIESLQDQENHKEGKGSLGGTVAVNAITGVVNGSVTGKVSGSYADYQSVKEQSGISAGKGGFAIGVGADASIKGGILASSGKAEDNKLSTNTLHVTNIDNQGISVAGGVGGTVVAGMTTVPGFTPDIDIPGFGKKANTTQGAIAEGTIEVRSGASDLPQLNRNPAEAHQTLDKTMDEAKIQEQKKVIKEVGEKIIDVIKDLAHKDTKKDETQQGGAEKPETK